ncbi:MAG: hypothetical protein C0598_06890 [Marinilabiliales bacterium]|nr:MAG: hypothetical protein C0598_06890 [Marinilabiliales bacterium]
MNTINLQKTIKAPASIIFEHISQQNKLMLWFAPQVIAVPAKDTIAAFAFGSEVNFKMKITEFLINKNIKWTCVDGNVDWINSIVIFDLISENDEKTILRFKHQKIVESEKIEQWKNSWKSYLSELKNICEQIK